MILKRNSPQTTKNITAIYQIAKKYCPDLINIIKALKKASQTQGPIFLSDFLSSESINTLEDRIYEAQGLIMAPLKTQLIQRGVPQKRERVVKLHQAAKRYAPDHPEIIDALGKATQSAEPIRLLTFISWNEMILLTDRIHAVHGFILEPPDLEEQNND